MFSRVFQIGDFVCFSPIILDTSLTQLTTNESPGVVQTKQIGRMNTIVEFLCALINIRAGNNTFCPICR